MAGEVDPKDQINFCVLCVEDNEYMLDVLLKSLKRMGMARTVGVKSVKEAVDYLKSSAKSAARGGDTIDMVVADLVTPPVNGIHLLRWLRSDKASPNRFMPFIMLSGAADRANITESRDLGVNLFMAKPYSIEKLYKALQRIVDAPRQFVMTQGYFGPDRRFVKPESPPNPERRKPDESHATIVYSDQRVEKAKTDAGDVWLFKLPNSLKQQLGSAARFEFTIPERILNSAQESLKREGDGFLGWAKTYLDQLSKELAAAKELKDKRDPNFAKINFIAHELRGQGGTFGFPLITAFGKSLFQVTTPPCRTDDAGIDIVKAHIDTLRAVIRDKIEGDGGEVGKALYMELRAGIAKHQAA